jgi:hypothetical protein
MRRQATITDMKRLPGGKLDRKARSARHLSTLFKRLFAYARTGAHPLVTADRRKQS